MERPSEWPVIDLWIARQRMWIALLAFLTCVNLVLLSMASVGAAHYMETTEFCGLVCHTTMEPQFVAHQSGAHARGQTLLMGYLYRPYTANTGWLRLIYRW